MPGGQLRMESSSGAPTSRVSGEPAWARLPDSPRILAEETHVVRAHLDCPDPELDRLRRFLHATELERSRLLRRALDARRAVASRGMLRDLLGRYLGRFPGRVELSVADRGKPLLRHSGPQVIHFNVSHCQGVALYAFTRIGPVGIDVEAVRQSNDLEALAERFFSRREVAQLRTLDPDMRVLAFFHGWTRKEALLKSTGEGLFGELSSFEVTLRPGEPACFVARHNRRRSAEGWTLQHLDPAPGYVGALAVHGLLGRLRCWTWTGYGRSVENPENPFREGMP